MTVGKANAVIYGDAVAALVGPTAEGCRGVALM
jgi:hypothetical protein